MRVFKFIISEFKYQYQSSYALGGLIFGILLNFLMYFYTSKAFSPNIDVENEYLKYGYFNFIILGELLLIIPQVAITEGQEYFMRLKEWGIIEQLILKNKKRLLADIYISLIFLKIFYLLLSLVIGLIFFNLDLNFFSIARLFVFQLVVVLVFYPFYLLNIYLTLILKRKTNIMVHAISILSFFSGAYFPLEIFRDEKIRIILKNSPISMVVEGARKFIYRGVFFSLDEIIVLVVYVALVTIAAKVFYRVFIKNNLDNFV